MWIVNKIKNKKGTALMMTILILTSVLVVALATASLVVQGMVMGRTQTYSTKAIFAAYAGIERVLYEIRINSLNIGACSNGNYIDFTPPPCSATLKSYPLGDASYYLIYNYNNPPTCAANTTCLKSVGSYKGVQRSVEASY